MPDRRLDVVSVHWYERYTAPPVAARWLDAARTHLPEALPRRFGDTEPLRGRFTGDEVFVEAHARADSLLHLQGTPPVHAASLAARHPAYWGPVHGHSLHVELPADDERVRAFALALTGPQTIYVSASEQRDLLLSRKTLVHDGPRTDEPYLAPLGDWLGLPPDPPVWCWFGTAYARAVGAGTWSGGDWVAPRLRARLDHVDPAQRHAPRLPRGLRRSPWRALFGK